MAPRGAIKILLVAMFAGRKPRVRDRNIKRAVHFGVGYCMCYNIGCLTVKRVYASSRSPFTKHGPLDDTHKKANLLLRQPVLEPQKSELL
jgi:hypothetical protein